MMGDQTNSQEGQALSEFDLPPKEDLDRALASLRPEEIAKMLDQMVDAIYEARATSTWKRITRTLQAWQAHGFVTSRPGYQPPEALAGSEWTTVDAAHLNRIIGR
jgi:hypothetical protein